LNEVDFLHALQAKQTDIVNATLNALTVQESYFFRDVSLFVFLKNVLLPKLIKEKQKKGEYQLTIWSAGCAFGEEIYSLAIYLDQLLPNIKEWEINLIATDINEEALEKGKKGIFTASSMRATDKVTLKEYFELHASSYVLKQRIREMVQFSHFNIAQTHKSVAKKFDLIFCRNVFIYLNQSIIESALQHFYDRLVDEGILFLGPSDLITYYSHSFSVEIISNLWLFRKNEKKKAQSPLGTLTRPVSELSLSYSEQLQVRTHQLKTIRFALDSKNYSEVLRKMDVYLSAYAETALLMRYKGEALMGLGDTDTALLYLNKSIQLDSLDAISHFLHALIKLDKKDNSAAISSLQKALYLKNNFPEAAYHLSLLYLQNKQEQQGMKLLKQSLLYAQSLSKEHPF
jgi:chemotaxis protein methyltransferase CheR